jgi:hypothetical protein
MPVAPPLVTTLQPAVVLAPSALRRGGKRTVMDNGPGAHYGPGPVRQARDRDHRSFGQILLNFGGYGGPPDRPAQPGPMCLGGAVFGTYGPFWVMLGAFDTIYVSSVPAAQLGSGMTRGRTSPSPPAFSHRRRPRCCAGGGMGRSRERGHADLTEQGVSGRRGQPSVRPMSRARSRPRMRSA